ncbi:MAG TPA: LysM domain-containing protein [Gammaproteobacteria bacterium]|nr:LysM domain-containing protein [Gammaproteobacteria bacterium]
MNHYTFPRSLAAGAIISLLAGCAHHAVKPAPVVAPAPATVAAPAAATVAPAPAMQPTAPQRYTVKKGDTLWGIAGMYLKNPWEWPEIWYDNPAIKNPHLIFPGDVLILGRNAQGQPTLSVERNGSTVSEATVSTAAAVSTAPAMATATKPSTGLPVAKLTPEPRYQPLDAAVTTVPMTGLLPYLNKTRIITDDELDNTGYLVTAFNQSPASGSGDEVYGRNLKQSDGTRYEIVRKGKKYVDPDSGDTLGYEALYIGDAAVETWGDPITKLMITSAGQEAIAGDHFVPTSGDPLNLNFFPHHPAKTIDGQIMSVLGGVGQIGQYAVVVLNRGAKDGVDPGAVLGIFRKGEKVKDRHAGWFAWSNVRLPTERTGTLMVFRVFKNASYALVMEAKHEIHVEDYVRNP